MAELSERNIWDRFIKWSGSAAGMAVILTIVVAVAATLDRGPYVMVNTVVTGGKSSQTSARLMPCFRASRRWWVS